MKTLRILLFAVAILFLAPGCSKDKKKSLSEQLVGTWDATSWTIDGVEGIPVFVTSFTIRLDKIIGGEGDTKWTVNYNPALGLPQDITNGRYTVNETRKEITFKQGSDESTLTFVIDGDNVEFEGTIDAEAHRIKMKRS